MRVLGCVLLLATVVLADYEETEHRLKAAGVDAAMRKRIHKAIDKGVAYLISKQRKDGSWAAQRGTGMRTWHPPEAETVYASLALRHAGTPTARRAARKGLDWLVPGASLGRKNLYRHIYIAGPMIMLLQAENRHDEVALKITETIEESQRKKSGWWGYLTFRNFGVETEFQSKDAANLSTTQFAALGLWAGNRIRGRAHVGVWSKHLESLVYRQAPNGSWGYAPFMTPADKRTYPCGTFMGTANLLLAIEGSGQALKLQPELAVRAQEAKQRALKALARDGEQFILRMTGLPDADARVSTSSFSYYALYALEKACLFADVEKLGDTRWYVEGADFLCTIQNEEGNWRRDLPGLIRTGDTISTCFALLFLLRSSQAYHPTTPRDVDLGKGPVTGKSEGKKKEEEKEKQAPPPPPGVELEEAFGKLETLRAMLGAKTSDGLPSPDRVREIRELWTTLKGDPKREAQWRDEATQLLLTLASHRPRPHPTFAKRWDALQVAALQVLVVTRYADPDRAWKYFENGPLRIKKWEPSEEYWTTLIFGLFPALGGDRSARKLFDTFTDLRDSERPRTLAALRGLREYRKLKPRTRYDLTRAIITKFEGLESAARKATSATDSESVRWRAYAPTVLRTLRALTRDARTGAFARTKKGRAPISLAEYRVWLGRHKVLARSPWRD